MDFTAIAHPGGFFTSSGDLFIDGQAGLMRPSWRQTRCSVPVVGRVRASRAYTWIPTSLAARDSGVPREPGW